MYAAILVWSALAQDTTTVELGEPPPLNAQTFAPVPSEDMLLISSSRRDARGIGFGAVGSYSDGLLVYEDLQGDRLEILGSVWQLDLLPSYTAGPVTVSADLPVIPATNGDSVSAGTGLGDASLLAKLAGYSNSTVAFGASGRLILPTGLRSRSLSSERVGWEGLILGELGSRLLARGTLGVRGGPNAILENLRTNDYLVWQVGGTLPVTDAAGLSAEISGRRALSATLQNPAASPTEWLASGFAPVAANWTLQGGVGGGLTPGIGSPDFRVVAGLRFTGEATSDDPDGDGVEVDQCPNDAEDFDGFQDDDGCPELDNDGDGVFDAADRCANESEDLDGFEDGDGCPDNPATVRIVPMDGDGKPMSSALISVDGNRSRGPTDIDLEQGAHSWRIRAPGYAPAKGEITVESTDPITVEVPMARLEGSRVTLGSGKLEIEGKVFFDTGSATISDQSHALLDEVAEVLTGAPEILLVVIEGHTDNVGDPIQNKKLSASRAASVVAYLVAQGVEKERLVSAGFGADRPVDPSNTEAARAKNRRVEFRIEKWAK